MNDYLEGLFVVAMTLGVLLLGLIVMIAGTALAVLWQDMESKD